MNDRLNVSQHLPVKSYGLETLLLSSLHAELSSLSLIADLKRQHEPWHRQSSSNLNKYRTRCERSCPNSKLRRMIRRPSVTAVGDGGREQDLSSNVLIALLLLVAWQQLQCEVAKVAGDPRVSSIVAGLKEANIPSEMCLTLRLSLQNTLQERFTHTIAECELPRATNSRAHPSLTS